MKNISSAEPQMPNLHGMSPARYIEILERTIRELREQNELCTKRIAELLDEKEEVSK